MAQSLIIEHNPIFNTESPSSLPADMICNGDFKHINLQQVTS